MTVHHDLRFPDAGVSGILQQEHRDLDPVIVGDGSGQDEVFNALQGRVPRIRIVVNPVIESSSSSCCPSSFPFMTKFVRSAACWRR
jgi:hypothetical protein